MACTGVWASVSEKIVQIIMFASSLLQIQCIRLWRKSRGDAFSPFSARLEEAAEWICHILLRRYQYFPLHFIFTLDTHTHIFCKDVGLLRAASLPSLTQQRREQLCCFAAHAECMKYGMAVNFYRNKMHGATAFTRGGISAPAPLHHPATALCWINCIMALSLYILVCQKLWCQQWFSMEQFCSSTHPLYT